MSNEELALALTEIAIKTNTILYSSAELPYDERGRNIKSIEESATEMVTFYKLALKAIAEK